MAASIDIDPNEIIQRYRAELEAARHNNLLLEMATQQLQGRVNILEEENKQLKERVELLENDESSEGDEIE